MVRTQQPLLCRQHHPQLLLGLSVFALVAVRGSKAAGCAERVRMLGAMFLLLCRQVLKFLKPKFPNLLTTTSSSSALLG